MDNIKKEKIREKLRLYCERYESQNKAAASMKGVSSATVSQVINGNLSQISVEMWRSIASQVGFKDDAWEVVETRDFQLLKLFMADAKENSLVLAITGNAGSGKTFALKHFAETNKKVYLLCCNEYWNRQWFLQELLSTMGQEVTTESVGDMIATVVRVLKTTEKPLIILDEADKLRDQVLYFFITLYNQLEDECGIVMCATNYLEKRLQMGLKYNKKGFAEIWSRIGRKCINLKGVSPSDISAVCEANGITGRVEIEKVINDSEGDLRRVRRKIHSIRKTA
jgi:DNA transposition AAA+ family ATPase